jgi:hypothetical protein
METIKVTDEEPDQDAVTSRRTGPEPSLFAGSLPVKWLGGRWAYSFLTRQQLDFRLTQREGAIIALDVPGDTLSVGGEVLFDQELGEQWGGLTWSRAVRENVGVGMTLYGVYRGSGSVRQTVEALGASGYRVARTGPTPITRRFAFSPSSVRRWISGRQPSDLPSRHAASNCTAARSSTTGSCR